MDRTAPRPSFLSFLREPAAVLMLTATAMKLASMRVLRWRSGAARYAIAKWPVFAKDWKARLAQDGLDHFHMAIFKADKPPFDRLSRTAHELLEKTYEPDHR